MTATAAILLSAGALADLTPTPLEGSRLTLPLPGDARLVAAGPAPDMPASVDRMVWRAEGDGVMVTIIYDRWSRDHLLPAEWLDRFTRAHLGLTDGELSDAAVAGYLGAKLRRGDSLSAYRISWGKEAWEIRIASPDGPIPAALEEEIIEGAALEPTEEELTSSIFETTNTDIIVRDPEPLQPADISARPEPVVVPWASLNEAIPGLAMDTPVTLIRKTAPRSDGETDHLADLEEWHGVNDLAEMFVSRIMLKPGHLFDLEAWATAFGSALTSEGFTGLSLARSNMSVNNVAVLRLIGDGYKDGQQMTVQIMLAVDGPQAWAIQSRAKTGALGDGIHQRVRESLKFTR